MDKYQKGALQMCKELKKEISSLIKQLKLNKLTEEEFNKELRNVKRELLSIYFNIA